MKDDCIGCAACFDVCPEEGPDRYFLSKGTRKAIHVAYPGSVPAAAAIDADLCRTLVGEVCEACVPLCPFESIDFTDRGDEIERAFGGVIVATGLVAEDLTRLPDLGLGRFDDVLTIDELSVLTASNGPTGGRVERADGSAPESAAFVHCAGSNSGDARTVGRLLARQGVSVTHLHHEVCVTREDGRLTVSADDLDPLTVDMVVLVNGRRPANEELSETLGLERSQDGYFLPAHAVLGVTATATDGIYLAGSVAGPCDAATAVTRAKAAAGEALSVLVPGRRIELETKTASIDEAACANCRFCLGACPYRAIEKDADAAVCRVNEALCRGCGTCAAGCPSGAARARAFTDEEMFAEISGVLHE